VKKIGLYATWLVFKSMELLNPFLVFIFRSVLFGRAIAYSPWERETYRTPNGEEVGYEGPGFDPCWPDDVVVPAENVKNIQEFSFVLRKYRATPQDLLNGEREGRNFGVQGNFQKIVDLASEGPSREPRGEEVQSEKDLAEGVTYQTGAPSKNTVIVWEWFGKWRLPLKGADDPPENDVTRREIDETELVVRYLPDANLVIGVQDLMELYPNMKDRRPFSEAAMVKDGSYWCPGFGELLESIEDESSANHNLFTEAGQLSVGPVIFYRPSSGFNPKVFRYEPGQAIPTEDPAGVNIVAMKTDLQYSILKDQAMNAMAERVVGQSDPTLGRSSEVPNAPRTAAGQIALMQKGDIRASLDTLILREEMRKIINRFWQLDSYFSPPSKFFRVTEEDAGGLFEVRNGGATITQKERAGRYDFDVKFATSIWSREAKKQQQLWLYQLDLQNPLIATNPRALWVTTNAAHKALGDDNFADIMPEPADLEQSKPPKQEWAMMLQGDVVEVNPLDNDDFHTIDHMRRAADSQVDPERDDDALQRMAAHIVDHQQQKQQKMLMQALVQKLTASVTQVAQSLPPGMLSGAGPMQEQMGQQAMQSGEPANGSQSPGAGLPMPVPGMQ